jgi:MFS family permease
MAHIRAKANRYNFAVAFFVALGSFTYGFNSAIIGSVIGQPSFYAYFDFVASSSYGASIIGASNGLYAGAGVIGSLTVFWFLDVLGRKRAIQIVAVFCVISAAIQAGSVHIAMFLVGRFLNGLAVAWINCSVPTYISEISPAAQRGRVVGAHGFIICCAYVSSILSLANSI